MVYKDEEYLKKEIMGQNRHQFIYGYDNEQRKILLQKLDGEYLVKNDCDYPICIYLNEFGLPKILGCTDELDNKKINILSREHLSFTVVQAILEKTKDNVDIELLKPRIIKLLEQLNKYDINSNRKAITSFDELFCVIKESKEFYESYYLDYVKTGKERKSIRDIAMPFLDLQYFILKYKSVLENNSYFALVLDKNKDITLSSTEAINSLIASRINSDISMKIVVEPDKWDCYVDSNGGFIEAVHDYGVIELDDSFKEYVKKIKNH